MSREILGHVPNHYKSRIPCIFLTKSPDSPFTASFHTRNNHPISIPERTPMSTVIFETKKAIFHFDLQDVFASLQDHSSCDQDATDLVNILESFSSETRRIPSEKGFFGYIVIDLLSRDKGFVFCKDRQKTYLSEELQSIPIGFGESPLRVKAI